MTTRFSIELNDMLNDTVTEIARRERASKSEVIRRAVTGYTALKERTGAGQQLFIREPDGTLREVILT